MRPSSPRGLTAATTMVRDVHLAVADRAFRPSGPAARPAQFVHRRVSVYSTVGGGTRCLRPARTGPSPRGGPGPVVPQGSRDRPRGSLVVEALNGARGATTGAVAMPARARHGDPRGGADVAPVRDAIAAGSIGVNGDVVVLLHGLCETDRSSRLSPTDPRATTTLRRLPETGPVAAALASRSGIEGSPLRRDSRGRLRRYRLAQPWARGVWCGCQRPHLARRRDDRPPGSGSERTSARSATTGRHPSHRRCVRDFGQRRGHWTAPESHARR